MGLNPARSLVDYASQGYTAQRCTTFRLERRQLTHVTTDTTFPDNKRTNGCDRNGTDTGLTSETQRQRMIVKGVRHRDNKWV